MSLTSIVNPETPPPRPSHVLATYRWPLVIVVLGLLALFAVLAFLWVAKRAYEDTLTRGGRAGEFAAQKAEDKPKEVPKKKPAEEPAHASVRP